MEEAPVRYRSHDDDSGRWVGFPFRDGDIVISTRSKSGTTWVQMICALLVFQTPELPAPLAELSPWLDWLAVPRDRVVAALEAQTHRRFIKTHTPLDGVPIDRRVTYLVVGRHPLDMAVSLYHHSANIDRDKLHGMLGAENAARDGYRDDRAPLAEWLRAWIEWNGTPAAQLDSLPGVLWHITDAWERRAAGNVMLVHYADLTADLDGEMRRLAAALGIRVPAARWPGLVAAAGFEQMRARARELAPGDVFKDAAAFFRRGTSGAAADVLNAEDRHRYEHRVRSLAPPEVVDWLSR